jgi:hypothetical protein
MKFLHSPVTSSLVGPNILLITLFSKTLSLHSSLNVSDQVSHPYKTTGKIIVLYILVFTFLDLYALFCHQISFGWSSQEDRWAGHMARMGERRCAYRALLGEPEGSRPLGKLRRGWKDIETDLTDVGGGGAWTGSIRLRIGTGRWLLWIQWWTFGFHKVRGISWVA